MNFFSKDNGKILFFTKNSPKYFTGSYSIILSPQFYWVKRVELPVTSEYKAKKLAPSIFEGSLPHDKFEYTVKFEKERGTFILIAYDKEEIFAQIKKNFFSSAKISGIYFAQYELVNLETCIAIDDIISLGNVDGLLIQVPSRCVQSEENIKKYLPKVTLSSKKIKYENIGTLSADANLFIPYFAMFAFLIFSQLFSYLAYSGDLDYFDSQKRDIRQRYNLPATSFQLNSIKKSLNKTYKEQKDIRELMQIVDKIHLKENEKIFSLTIKRRESKIQIKTTNSRNKDLLDEFKRTVRILNSDFADNILTIEFDHE